MLHRLVSLFGNRRGKAPSFENVIITKMESERKHIDLKCVPQLNCVKLGLCIFHGRPLPHILVFCW